MNEEKQSKEVPVSIPFFLHEAEMTRLDFINRRLCKLALAGWGVSFLYVLIDVIAKIITK